MGEAVKRNEPCPCYSGKKFKDCCAKQFVRTGGLPWPTYPERFVLGGLLRSSEIFNKYYVAERPKISEPLFWARDANLPTGINYRFSGLALKEQAAVTLRPTRILAIRLRRVPAPRGEGFDVAHELEHIRVLSKGFPAVGWTRPEYENAGAALVSMLHDILVNSTLRDYGFDLAPNYDKESKENLAQLRSLPTQPTDNVVRAAWVFNYTSNLLDRDLLGEEPCSTDREFQKWFDAAYPSLAEEGRRLFGLIGTSGFETPGKMTSLISEIIASYSLREVLTVIPF